MVTKNMTSPSSNKSLKSPNTSSNKVKRKSVKKVVVKKSSTKNVFQEMENAKKKYFENNPGNSNARNTFYDNVIRISSNIDEKPFKRKEPKQDWSVYKTEEEYEASMKSSIEFSNKYTKKQKESFDTLIYHHNSDGIMSAYIAWDYITDGGTNGVKLSLISLKPDKNSKDISTYITKIEHLIKDKKVFMVDLSYNKKTMEHIKNITKEFVSIDNHRNPEIQGKLDYAYITDDRFDEMGTLKSSHGACAAVWKFFYPTEPVPYVIQSIDSSDVKLYLSYLPDPDAIIMAMNVQFVKNQKKNYHIHKEQLFIDVHTFITKGSDIQNLNFLTIVGQIMNRYAENMKNEIARQAQPGKFIGKGKTYNVYILNYAQPGLLKRVGKNIAENHREADFAVIWFYDFGKKQFEINLISSHRSGDKKVDIKKIASDFGGFGDGDHARFSYKGNIGSLEKILQ